jgi:hypothetical protein
LFLKGLELHGKGWKKIASLIKTRTVVQIRTHAQKYFLKLQKARQGGDGNGMLVEGKSLFGCRKRRKRRLQDRPVCLPLHLKPFFGISSEGSAAVELGDKDIDEGLYNFLSPMFEATSSACTSLETPNAAESSSVQQTSDAHLLTMGVMARPPEWYQRGYHVDKLLQDAEALDWNADSGEAVTQPLSKRSLQPRIVVDAKTAGSQTISPNLASDVSKQAQSSQSDGWDTSISQECFSELLGTFTETTEEIRVAAPRNTVGEVSAGAIDTEGDRLRARTGTSDVSPLEVQLGKSLQGRAEVWDTHLTSDTFSDLVMHAYYVDEEDLVTAKSENNETEK